LLNSLVREFSITEQNDVYTIKVMFSQWLVQRQLIQ